MKNYDYESQIPKFILASHLTSYPDETYKEYLSSLLDDPTFSGEEFANLKQILEQYAHSDESVDAIRSNYIDLFDRGRSENSMCETEYGRNRTSVKTPELADLAGFYKAFGFEFGTEDLKKEMLDHLSVELEFYSILLMKEAHQFDIKNDEAVAIIQEARAKFLTDHLGRFTEAMLERPRISSDSYYSTVLTFVNQIVTEECANLNANPVKVTFLSNTPATDEIGCGSCPK